MKLLSFIFWQLWINRVAATTDRCCKTSSIQSSQGQNAEK